MKLVFDIETDGLYQDATQIWCMVAIDENNKVYTYNPDQIDEGIKPVSYTHLTLPTKA